jgi:hypothetical protein
MGFKWRNISPRNVLYKTVGGVSWIISLIFFPQIWAVVTLTLIVFQVYRCQIIEEGFKKISQPQITIENKDTEINHYL